MLGSLAALLILDLLVFGNVHHFGFVSFDDPSYVSENVYVSAGLTWRGVVWAFSGAHSGYWIPFTWLSYMADVEVFGPGAGGHHLVNLLFHVFNGWLLYGLLRRLTGSTGRSLFVAALFAVHPLHVESVAWITERKDVLSTFFLLLTLWSYARYARAASAWRLVMVAAWFACGLMAKPMVVTLPALLLLLDVWPLGRLRLSSRSPADSQFPNATTWRRAICEKLPLFGLAVAASVATIVAQHEGGAVAELGALGPLQRVTTAVVAYATYVWKTIWPSGLAAFYPLEPAIPASDVALALALLVGLSYLAFRLRRHPFVLVGWLWYLVSLAPVSGLLQSGGQAMADRFTYVPLIGLFVIIAWGVVDALPRARRVLAVTAVAVVAVLTVVARGQAETWKDDESLWTHALEVVPDNYFAHNSLGRLLYARGDVDLAARHFTEAARLAPRFYDARSNLGIILLQQGRLDDAIVQLREAVRLNPTAEALCSLGGALGQRGEREEAETCLRAAIRLKPELTSAHFNLGLMLARHGRYQEALEHYEVALRLDPNLVPAHLGIGEALASQGRTAEAVPHFVTATQLAPDSEQAHLYLGMALAASGDVRGAAVQLQEVLRLNPGNDVARKALAQLPKS